jgi:hypothetical protein
LLDLVPQGRQRRDLIEDLALWDLQDNAGPVAFLRSIDKGQFADRKL